jgi:hypothetical protein
MIEKQPKEARTGLAPERAFRPLGPVPAEGEQIVK